MTSYNYSGPGLPMPLMKAAESFAEALRVSGYAEPALPGHRFVFHLAERIDLVITATARAIPLPPGDL